MLLVGLGQLQLYFYDLEAGKDMVLPYSNGYVMWGGILASVVLLTAIVTALFGWGRFTFDTEDECSSSYKNFWIVTLGITLSIVLSGVFSEVLGWITEGHRDNLIVGIHYYVFSVFSGIANVCWYFVLMALWLVTTFNGYKGSFESLRKFGLIEPEKTQEVGQ